PVTKVIPLAMLTFNSFVATLNNSFSCWFNSFKMPNSTASTPLADNLTGKEMNSTPPEIKDFTSLTP
ncbi:hypothetical protein WICPIJ_008338, partial [Wickerhamomyces pijperi]